MTYIADSIGTEYEQWRGGDVVFIASPTGSGKTTFILKNLLPFLYQGGQKMLYLVNRTVLKEQLNEEIKCLPIKLRECIDVELYQTLERELSRLKFDGEFLKMDRSLMCKYNKYNYVVCDEAHYFMMDSNYNTNTILSYKFINICFWNKLRIYMSATIENIEEVICQDIENEKYIQSFWLGFHSNGINRLGLLHNRKTYRYKAERNYKHIEVGVLKSREEIKEIIVGGTEKWLVFVDSKMFGKTLMKELFEGFKAASKEETVAFVTSDYALDEEAAEVVGTIVTEGKQTPKVLIATSVLDNGINIKDIGLRNIIIVADTEIEFIQMLGRKRNDGSSIKLYVYKHDKNHFIRRKRINTRRQEIAEKYYKAIKEQIEHCDQNSKEIIDQTEIFSICSQHQIWLKKLMNNEVSYEDIKSVFLAVDGFLVLNMLSFQNIENLNQFYVKLLEKFEIYEEDAFLREQLLWLGKSEEEIEKIISDANKCQYEKSREKVIKALESIENKEMDKAEHVAFKNTIASDLKELVEYVGKEHPEYKKFMDLCKKNDRSISRNFMDFLQVNCGIPFTVKNGSNVVIKHEE